MDPQQQHRTKLLWDTLIGFLGFFAVLAVIQAVINLFAPEPAVWPAVVALVLVLVTVATWRARRHRFISKD